MSKVQIKPRLPKGMRDFLPDEMIKRDYVFDIVREMFHLYGFEPLQTPVLELQVTLLGKYGEDAEKLIFHSQHPGGKEELALRYDLTVPLARVVAQHENDITLPFKRYQLSPVWRAERPQKGRYREFYQCDTDIVGVESMIADAELISLVVATLRRLGFGREAASAFTVKINNRKLLTAMGQYAGVPDEQLGDLYRSVDKFDKVGAEGVGKELEERGIGSDVVQRMMDLLVGQGTGLERLDFVEALMGQLGSAKEGIRELREMAASLDDLNVSPDNYEFDFTMVRGLGYYTGPIFETVIDAGGMGSLSGGGRYDDLIGIFRKESLPTTGVSLGIERIIDLMDEFGLYPDAIAGTVVEVLVTVFDDQTRAYARQIAADLRRANIRTELYLLDKKLGQQFKHADKKGIPFVIVAGPEEAAQGVVKLKRLSDGEERTVARDALATTVADMRF